MENHTMKLPASLKFSTTPRTVTTWQESPSQSQVHMPAASNHCFECGLSLKKSSPVGEVGVDPDKLSSAMEMKASLFSATAGLSSAQICSAAVVLCTGVILSTARKVGCSLLWELVSQPLVVLAAEQLDLYQRPADTAACNLQVKNILL